MLLYVIDIAHVSGKFAGFMPSSRYGEVEASPAEANDRLEWATSSKNCVLILKNKDLVNLILKTKHLFHLILKTQGLDLRGSVQRPEKTKGAALGLRL